MARFNLQEVAVTPPTPAPGFSSIYFKSDHVLYILDSSGVETPIGTASGITSLTGDVSATGPGAAVTTVNFVGGSSAVNIHSAELLANASTAANTASAIIRRDSSGNYAANIASLNAIKLLGSVSGILTLASAATFADFTLTFPTSAGLATQALVTDGTGVLSWASIISSSLADGKILVGNGSNIAVARTPGGDVSMTDTAVFTVLTVGGSSAANIHSAELLANAATAANTANAIVKRDALGGFAAGAISMISFVATGTSDMVQGVVKGFVGQGSDLFQVLKSDNTVLFKVDNSGNGVLSGTITASNFSGTTSGTNTGDVSFTAVGSSPSANGASLSGQVITLQPADGTHPGLLTAIAQSIGGVKTFLAQLLVSDTTQSTSTSTGSAVLSGGLGIAKNLNVGGNAVITGTIGASNFSGSSSGTNTGDITILDTDSIDLTLAGQLISGVLKLSSDAADAGNVKATVSIHSGAGAGLHIEFPFGNPVQVGTSNNPGSAVSFSLSDHVHAHGAQTDPTLHAIATGSANGFMSAVDKTKLDAATALNTASTLVFRDPSGNFAAGIITATLNGTATNFSGSLSGDVTGTQSATAIASTVVTAKLLTGYVIGSNTLLAATDSILIAFEKLQGQISASVGAAITALTGDVSASGPGSVAATVNSVGGSSAANIHLAELAANAATALNTASTIMKRDASGNYAASRADLTSLGVNDTSATSTVYFKSAAVGTPTFTIKQITSQTADLMQILDSSGAPQMIFTSGGNFKFFHNASIPEARFDLRPSVNVLTINTGANARYSMFVGDSTPVQAAGQGGGIAFGASQDNIGTATEMGFIWTTKNNSTAGNISSNMHFATRNNATGNAQRVLDMDELGNSIFWGNITLSGATSTTALQVATNTLIVDSVNNTLGINTAPASTTVLDIVNNSGAIRAIQSTSYGFAAPNRGRYANGTLASPTAATAGNSLHSFSGRGYGATGFAAASTGVVTIAAGATFTDTSMPTYITLSTTPSASVTTAERMRINSTGNILIGTTTDNATDLVQLSAGIVSTYSKLAGATSGFFTQAVPATVTSYTLTWPAAVGTAGSFLSIDGSGNASWTNPLLNIDGGRPDSVYTVNQSINGGTP